MRFYKKLIFLIACLSFLFSMSNFRETYAKYRTSIDGSTSMNVARWRILVNNQDIRNNSGTTLTITPTFPGSSNIASTVIAPTAEGYFDLVVDGTDADVSFSYEISADVDENSSVTDLIITGYSIDGGAKQTITNGDSVTGNIYLNDNSRVKTLRVFVKWEDFDSTATMNNAADTAATLSSDPALMDVTINFTQIA